MVLLAGVPPRPTQLACGVLGPYIINLTCYYKRRSTYFECGLTLEPPRYRQINIILHA